ncbi:MATE family efflux transporter [Alkaliphilus peptidifermentans]|uniref:Probable multidrug resistance protein NorM n=1 Tax=Alkaliphilus peptidifermentans DSM 18978 TaxID=1120976 RepID=A0A1G5KT82_9FIRM|nr:MATE family efflux transporter [Alkaliphilus peptidifermentans]SCZ03328.1 putative efflux protein, MATE family [Alkaliphilus peptidifermentans DSM 18978]
MQKDIALDLQEGSISKNLLSIATPTMLGFTFQMFYDLVDMMWIGRISAEAVAGITIFSTMFWIVNILNEIIGTSSISLISQSYGKGDQDRTSLCIEQTLTFKAMVAVLAGVIFSIILRPLLGFFTQDPVVSEAALSYGYIRIFFLPIMFSSYTVNTAFRCVGDAKRPMIIMVTAAILNIVLDPIFIFDTIPGTSIPGLGLGVFGAALATVISISVTFIIGFAYVLSNKTKVKIKLKRLLKLNFEIDKKLITIGLPNGIEAFLRNLVGIFTLKFITYYGTETVAAMGIGNRLIGFAFMPLLGLSMASSTIVGQSLGFENLNRAKATARTAAIFGSVIMVLVCVITFIFPESIMKIFINDPTVVEIGVPMLRIIFPCLILAGVVMGYGSVFSGSGYNRPYLYASVIARWAVQIPLMFLIVKILKVSVEWVWLTFLIAEFVEMLVMIINYRMGKWETNRV